MRDNLVFTGIPERIGEDCEYELYKYLAEALVVHKHIQLERVHRLGQSKGPGTDRPIVATFASYKAAPRYFKGTSYGVNEQFPKEMNEVRWNLVPYLKQAKPEGKSCDGL